MGNHFASLRMRSLCVIAHAFTAWHCVCLANSNQLNAPNYQIITGAKAKLHFMLFDIMRAM